MNGEQLTSDLRLSSGSDKKIWNIVRGNGAWYSIMYFNDALAEWQFLAAQDDGQGLTLVERDDGNGLARWRLNINGSSLLELERGLMYGGGKYLTKDLKFVNAI